MAQRLIVRVNGNVQWHWRVAAGGNYVAVCDALKLTLQSKTWSELVEDMNITLDALISDLMESNEWDSFMREHGWNLVNAMPVQHKNVQFEVPFSIQPYVGAMNEHGSQRSVYQ
jgi:hypothetical protein